MAKTVKLPTSFQELSGQLIEQIRNSNGVLYIYFVDGTGISIESPSPLKIHSIADFNLTT